MYRYQRLLVPLSLTEQDESAIRYAELISRLANSRKVTFAHVAEPRDSIPEELRVAFPDIDLPSDELVKTKMEELVTSIFPTDGKPALAFERLEGSPLFELLRHTKDSDIDLIVMAKKNEPAEVGSLPEKLIRKAPCSVLLVPEKAKPAFSNILSPTDFSEGSIDAMDVAVAFASAGGIDEIYSLHAYTVPVGYYKTGKSQEEFAEIMKGHAEKNFNNFLHKEICQTGSVCLIKDLKGIEVTPIFMLEKKPAKAIEEVVKNHNIDLLVIGARGRRAGAGVLLGSVTEHQIKTTTIPILAVKKKGSGLSILEAILKL